MVAVENESEAALPSTAVDLDDMATTASDGEDVMMMEESGIEMPFETLPEPSEKINSVAEESIGEESENKGGSELPASADSVASPSSTVCVTGGTAPQDGDEKEDDTSPVVENEGSNDGGFMRLFNPASDLSLMESFRVLTGGYSDNTETKDAWPEVTINEDSIQEEEEEEVAHVDNLQTSAVNTPTKSTDEHVSDESLQGSTKDDAMEVSNREVVDEAVMAAAAVEKVSEANVGANETDVHEEELCCDDDIGMGELEESGIEMPYEVLPPEEETSNEEKDKTRAADTTLSAIQDAETSDEVQEQEESVLKSNSSSRKKFGSRMLSWRKNKRTPQSEVTEQRDDDEGVETMTLEDTDTLEDTATLEDTVNTTGSDESASLGQHDQARLNTLVAEEAAEEEVEMEKEVEELINSVLLGFDNDVVEKKLNEQMAGTKPDFISMDVQQEAEGYLSSWVDKMEVLGAFDGACGNRCGIRYSVNDRDDMSRASAPSGKQTKPMPKLVSSWLEKMKMMDALGSFGACGSHCGSRYSTDDDMSYALSSVPSVASGNKMKDVLNDFTFGTGLTTVDDGPKEVSLTGDGEIPKTVSFEDESLASEYDDFNKAMMMVKNRAARRRLSEAALLQKIQAEQKRRMSVGLTPSMIEI